jgi:hypothetical protein
MPLTRKRASIGIALTLDHRDFGAVTTFSDHPIDRT